MRISAAIFICLHGLIHLMGFVVQWQLAVIEDLSYKTTILADTVNIGHTGARIVGALWLLAAGGFVAVAVMMLKAIPGWPAMLLSVTAFSLVVTILGWPDSRFGVFINIIILAWLFWNKTGYFLAN